MEIKIIVVSRAFPTPLGTMVAGANRHGLCKLEFADARHTDRSDKHLASRFDQEVLRSANKHLELAQIEIEEYFCGNRKRFSVPLYIPGTEFQQAVWSVLQDIPYGATRTYKQQATILQNPKAVRAVASANGMNRVAIIVPCHRVIGESGHLTGYAGGLARKRWLLDHEARHSDQGRQVELGF